MRSDLGFLEAVRSRAQRPGPELLAPAGGPSQLDAAIRFGADAVFLAADRYGMRARADNFSLDEIPSAVSRAHEAGVKVHVTLNVLMNDRDLDGLPAYCEALDAAEVDAFIVGDMGAFAVAQRHAPRVDLHISTQASVSNAQAASLWHSLGAKRIVCAREMSMNQIAEMRAKVPRDLEIEVFVHGAMCMAYSGRCLLSSAMTGRSGNKGACAQSCRWNYALVEEKRPGEYFPIEEDGRGTYIMNAEDLCMIRHLDELCSIGVDSLKIEGRNKRAFYVATVVGAYRSALDGGDVDAAERELFTISHRPYGTGFYFGRPNQSRECDGYVKECLHVATVERSERVSAGPREGKWRVTALCQNRFFEGDRLEAISPHRPSFSLTASSLALLAPADGGLPFVERKLPLDEVLYLARPEPCRVANRAGEHYVFHSDAELSPGDFVRRRIEGQTPRLSQ